MTKVSFREPWKVRRPASFPGAGLFVVVPLLVGVLGCGSPSDDPSAASAEEREALGLRAGAELHKVTLGGRGAEEHAVPTRVVAEPGDAVEFRTVDHRVHTVAFAPDSLSEESRAFLGSTGQLASQPLVSRGSRFIVRFQDAPPGRYPFVSNGHGGTAWGVVEIGLPPTDTLEGEGGP